MNPTWINSHQDALYFPPDDAHLLLEVHSYSPYNFCGKPTKTAWDASVINSCVAGLDAWATQRNRSVLVGEFGCRTSQTNTSGRYQWYSYMVDNCRAKGWASASRQLESNTPSRRTTLPNPNPSHNIESSLVLTRAASDMHSDCLGRQRRFRHPRSRKRQVGFNGAFCPRTRRPGEPRGRSFASRRRSPATWTVRAGRRVRRRRPERSIDRHCGSLIAVGLH